MPVRHGAFASSVAVLVASLVVLAVLSAVHASSTCLSRPGVQEARARLARALPPPCPDEGWVPHILSQKCYKRFERQVDFFACQTEVCGPRNATIVTPRTEEIQRFVHLKVVAPHVGVDAVRSQEAYWIGMYRQPELRERWVWVSYGLLEDMADARPVSRSFFWAASENQPNDWEGRESCAIARALGNHYDVSCQGRYNDGQRFKYPCVCQFPDVPHPEFELDMHASRDVQAHTIASHTAERVFVYAAYALFGLYGLLFCRAAVVVAAGSATTRPHALGAQAREALAIFPLGLTLTVGVGVAGGKVEPKTPPQAWPAELSVETPSAPSRRAVLERMPGQRDLVGTVWLRRNLHLGSSLVRADTVWLRRNRHHAFSHFDTDDRDDAAGDVGADAPAYGKDDHRSLVWRRVDRGLRRLLLGLTTLMFISIVLAKNLFQTSMPLTITTLLAVFLLSCIGHRLLFHTVVKYRLHCVNVMDGLTNAKDMQRLTRAAWSTLFFIELVCATVITLYADRWLESHLVPLWIALMLWNVPTLVAAGAVILGLIRGHGGCIRSLKDHMVRHLCSADHAAADTQAGKELICLAELHAQMMDKTKSLVSLSLTVIQLILIVLAYFMLRESMTSVTSFVTYGRPQALIVGLLGIVCVGLVAANLFAMAKLGDDYTDLLRHLHAYRGQATGPDAELATKLLEYFADGEVMKSHCWQLTGKSITSGVVYQTIAGIFTFVALSLLLRAAR